MAATGEGTEPHAWKDPESRNGWPVLAQAPSHRIEGSGQEVRLAAGDAAVILLHVARRFHSRSTPCARATCTAGRPTWT
ncbi:hypothetical protein [Streptomyces thermodiastaticus]|uniref:hypothetical protein n=1 Tax=Streptomyces thermodiastaticus TaxID=44061 RepID=UPI0016775A25|nr:hypothetical protein [Streptomyces thermodiastaticus]MCE7553500.1 hypothetical protein [Streptomyces thermodiastaticus]GHE24189.1 hypothetical protein GCM10018787_53560 [Streptomyces thermodiastaticus]